MLAPGTEPETHSTAFVLVREEGGNKRTEEDKSKEQDFTKQKHRNQLKSSRTLNLQKVVLNGTEQSLPVFVVDIQVGTYWNISKL